jgi:hypothetical protein
MINSDLHTLTALAKPLPMHQMAPHLPNPSRICYSANRNCSEAHQCNPLELVRAMEKYGNNMLTQFEQRNKAILHASER